MPLVLWKEFKTLELLTSYTEITQLIKFSILSLDRTRGSLPRPPPFLSRPSHPCIVLRSLIMLTMMQSTLTPRTQILKECFAVRSKLRNLFFVPYWQDFVRPFRCWLSGTYPRIYLKRNWRNCNQTCMASKASNLGYFSGNHMLIMSSCFIFYILYVYDVTFWNLPFTGSWTLIKSIRTVPMFWKL